MTSAPILTEITPSLEERIFSLDNELKDLKRTIKQESKNKGNLLKEYEKVVIAVRDFEKINGLDDISKKKELYNLRVKGGKMEDEIVEVGINLRVYTGRMYLAYVEIEQLKSSRPCAKYKIPSVPLTVTERIKNIPSYLSQIRRKISFNITKKNRNKYLNKLKEALPKLEESFIKTNSIESELIAEKNKLQKERIEQIEEGKEEEREQHSVRGMVVYSTQIGRTRSKLNHVRRDREDILDRWIHIQHAIEELRYLTNFEN